MHYGMFLSVISLFRPLGLTSSVTVWYCYSLGIGRREEWTNQQFLSRVLWTH